MITDNWKKIAEHNGLDGSLIKLGEECDELDQAIEEYTDARNNATSNAEINEARDHVILECADVRACVDQVLWHLHGEEECDAAMQWKLIRTMQRIRDDAE